jgi:hypothetical protein
MKKKIFVTVFCAVLVFAAAMKFCTKQAAADTFMPPEPFEIWSQDGRKVFRWTPFFRRTPSRDYWTARADMEQDGEMFFGPLFTMEDLPAMGVSVNNFIFSQDFRHFMFIPATGFEVAMEFYSMGELVKTYYIRDLIWDLNELTTSVSMVFWRALMPDVYPQTDRVIENDILHIMTTENTAYGFCLNTGAVLLQDPAWDMDCASRPELNESSMLYWHYWAQEQMELAESYIPDDYEVDEDIDDEAHDEAGVEFDDEIEPATEDETGRQWVWVLVVGGFVGAVSIVFVITRRRLTA